MLCSMLYRKLWLYFETPDHLYRYISELFEAIATLPEAKAALKSLTLNVQFNYSTPDCQITLTAANGEYTLARGTL